MIVLHWLWSRAGKSAREASSPGTADLTTENWKIRISVWRPTQAWSLGVSKLSRSQKTTSRQQLLSPKSKFHRPLMFPRLKFHQPLMSPKSKFLRPLRSTKLKIHQKVQARTPVMLLITELVWAPAESSAMTTPWSPPPRIFYLIAFRVLLPTLTWTPFAVEKWRLRIRENLWWLNWLIAALGALCTIWISLLPHLLKLVPWNAVAFMEWHGNGCNLDKIDLQFQLRSILF